MFALRRITGRGLESNTALGESYNINKKLENPSEFERTMYAFITQEGAIDVEVKAQIYGFVISEGGREIIPLYCESRYYVMTGKGDTYANVSFRK